MFLMAGSGLTCLDAHILLSLDPMMLKYDFSKEKDKNQKRQQKKPNNFRSKFERNKKRAILTTNSDKSLKVVVFWTQPLCYFIM